MTSAESNQKEHLQPPPDRFNLQSGLPNRLQSAIAHLNLGTKIGLGYALALGIGVMGTICGFLLGNSYSIQAEFQKEQIQQDIRFLYRLQTELLGSRSQQQKLFGILENPTQVPPEYAILTARFERVRALLSEPQLEPDTAAENAEIQEFIATEQQTIESYYQKVEELLQPFVTSSVSPDRNRVAALEPAIVFNNDPLAIEFDALSVRLDEAIAQLETAEALAIVELNKADRFRNLAIVAIALLSAAIALVLAFYTSRAIARPLHSVTDVAKQVTKEANFDLQVPVTSNDEIGILADSINQLIFKVRNLLDNLHAEREAQLIQSEKMASLGRMLANVAQEIKNPLNFIYGNLEPAEEYYKSLILLLDTYSNEIGKPPPSVRCLSEEIELDFLKDDLPKVMRSMKAGAKRARALVMSVKNLASIDETHLQMVNLHKGLDSSLLIFRNRLKKHGIKVVRNYGEIPEVEGYTGLLYQVFMNVLTNAIEALTEKTAEAHPKKITITTRRVDSDRVEVRIADNGIGIPEENQSQIFDAFFTTKNKGVNHGLGLVICRQIVVSKHGGNMTFESIPGADTEFAIVLPLQHEGSSRTFIQAPFS